MSADRFFITTSSRIVHRGSRRGVKYEIYHDPSSVAPFRAILYVPTYSTASQRYEMVSQATPKRKSLDAAIATVDSEIEYWWKSEQRYTKSYRRGTDVEPWVKNPISNTVAAVLTTAAGVGFGLFFYELFTKARS